MVPSSPLELTFYNFLDVPDINVQDIMFALQGLSLAFIQFLSISLFLTVEMGMFWLLYVVSV